MVRFIHVADLHLDSPFSGLRHLPETIWEEMKESTFLSLHRIVTHAIEKQVDFVLVAGDVYDIEERSVKAQARLKQEMERLNEKNIPVYMIHGNHDFLGDTSLHLSLPGNVTVLGRKVETVEFLTKSNERIAVSGFSYCERWIHERMITHYPERFSSVDFHIGLLHGSNEGEMSEHANYAPFSIEELKEKEYDYWALGHIHKREQLSEFPLAYYSGNIQGRHKNEPGEKGALLVELSNHQHSVEFLSTAPIVWQELEINAEYVHTLGEIFDKIKSELPEKNSSQLLLVSIVLSDKVPDKVRKKLLQTDFLQGLQQINEEKFRWFVRLMIKSKDKTERIPTLEKLFPEAWERVVEEAISKSGFKKITNDFFLQTEQAFLLEDRSYQYRKRLVNEAVKQLGQAMKETGEPE